jgi:hypothetical protein
MTAFLPPSLVQGVVAIGGEVGLATLLGWLTDSLDRSSVRACRLGGEALPWPLDERQFADLAVNSTGPGLHIETANGTLDIHRFDQPDRFPSALGPVATPAWRLNWTSPDLSGDADPARLKATRDAIATLVEALWSVGAPLEGATVLRQASRFAPSPPQAPPEAMLFLADAAALARQYVSPDAYWRAWDVASEVRAGRVLVSRALTVDDECAFKAKVYPATWDLARAARTGLTLYGDPEILPDERALFEAGEPTITQLGFDDETHRLEYTAYVGEGGHILPREVYLLRRLLLDRRLSDGSRLEAIRVSFPDQAMARREFTPLHDVGVEVAYLASEGRWDILQP